ncbi:MAG: polysaccharide deacetylase family protein [Ramlibacter sp.]|nr:polysaccharide deacetylase family protein [Ramlibacter sp.]
MNLRSVFAALLMVCAMFSDMASAQTLSLTFDDGLDPDKEPQAREWNTQLLEHLRKADIKAMVFPALARTGDGAGRALIADWAAAGHGVGNHTSRHRSLGSQKVSLEAFIEDVNEADAAFNALPTWQRRLRFPYLKEGDTVDKRDGMRAWMYDHGYESAPVSIDTSDWYYNDVFLTLSKASGQEAKLDILRAQYLRHLLDRAGYYDKLASQVMGRRPMHVMLLHVNAINATWLPQVVEAFKGQGWTIVSPRKAFTDPLYDAPPDTLPAGESIVWALAKAIGVKGLRYPAEDGEYEGLALRSVGLPAP